MPEADLAPPALLWELSPAPVQISCDCHARRVGQDILPSPARRFSPPVVNSAGFQAGLSSDRSFASIFVFDNERHRQKSRDKDVGINDDLGCAHGRHRIRTGPFVNRKFHDRRANGGNSGARPKRNAESQPPALTGQAVCISSAKPTSLNQCAHLLQRLSHQPANTKLCLRSPNHLKSAGVVKTLRMRISTHMHSTRALASRHLDTIINQASAIAAPPNIGLNEQSIKLDVAVFTWEKNRKPQDRTRLFDNKYLAPLDLLNREFDNI